MWGADSSAARPFSTKRYSGRRDACAAARSNFTWAGGAHNLGGWRLTRDANWEKSLDRLSVPTTHLVTHTLTTHREIQELMQQTVQPTMAAPGDAHGLAVGHLHGAERKLRQAAGVAVGVPHADVAHRQVGVADDVNLSYGSELLVSC